MKRGVVTLVVGLLFIVTACVTVNQWDVEFIPQDVITKVDQHAVAIAVYYTMSDEEYYRRMEEMRRPGMPNIRYLMCVYDLSQFSSPVKCLAYIGAGGIVKDNHVVTVKHLFDHGENTYSRAIWIFQQYTDHVVEGEVIAESKGETFSDDYAVVKLKEDLKLPGLSIAPIEVEKGSPVYFIGSTGGLAFHSRFGRATQFQRFFKVDDEGILHLAMWENFKYLMVYPSGPGDSGGIVIDQRGDIVGIMYCGIEIYAEHYCFANPIKFLWEFLWANKLGNIG